jgi:positive regulator of sigma E activity
MAGVDEAPAAAHVPDDGMVPPDDDDPAEIASLRIERTAATIYGTIVAGSVLAAVAGHSTVGEATLAVVVTVTVYWLAESYAHVVALRLIGASPRHRAHVRQHLRSTAALVTASFAPLAAMLLAALLGADSRRAITVALIFTSVWLGALGWISARRAGLHGLAVVASTVGSSLIGLVLIALKFALH